MSTATTFTITSGVSSGASYLVRLRALNVRGWSSYSSDLSIQAAGAPYTPNTPLTKNPGYSNSIKIDLLFLELF